jgi:pentose-5-phosphate-3-epimerase
VFPREISSSLNTLPESLKTRIVFDYHLMTEDYIGQINDIVSSSLPVKTRTVLVHLDLQPDPLYLSSKFPDYTFAVVLNSENSVSDMLKNYKINSFPVIQLMTVHVGFQGNAFIHNVLSKIEQLRNQGFTGKIYLDGGINRDTIPVILSQKNLPDVLCVGSYLTRSQRVEEDVNFIEGLLGKKQQEE